MTLVLARSMAQEDEIAFKATAQALFGHISQRFLDHRGPLCRLTTTALGRCQMTEIKARAHGVLGERVVRSSHDVDSVKIMMQLDGLTSFKQNGDRAELGAGSLLLYDPTRPYLLVNATTVHQVIFQVPRDMFGASSLAQLAHSHLYQQGGDGLPHIVSSVLAATAREVGALAQSARTRVGDTLARLIASLVSGETEIPLSGEAAALKMLRYRIIGYIDAHYEDPDLSIDQVATALKCSKRYIHRAFEDTALKPERYLWEVRLERCRESLLAAEKLRWSLSEIAFSCGFSSSAHFSRSFKARYGMTPRHFRLYHAA